MIKKYIATFTVMMLAAVCLLIALKPNRAQAAPSGSFAPGCYADTTGGKSTAPCDGSLTDTTNNKLDPTNNCYIVAPETLPAGASGPAGSTYTQVSCTDLKSSPTSSGQSTRVCNLSNNWLFGLLKPWYAYLPQSDFVTNSATSGCDINISFVNSTGGPNQTNINSLWLIGLAIFEDLLRIAGLAAVGFVIYGGVRYVTSQGEPENTKAAQSTIINALIGAAIATIAAAVVSFLGGKLGAG